MTVQSACVPIGKHSSFYPGANDLQIKPWWINIRMWICREKVGIAGALVCYLHTCRYQKINCVASTLVILVGISSPFSQWGLSSKKSF